MTLTLVWLRKLRSMSRGTQCASLSGAFTAKRAYAPGSTVGMFWGRWPRWPPGLFVDVVEAIGISQTRVEIDVLPFPKPFAGVDLEPLAAMGPKPHTAP